jgi:uncharacterized Zn-binding protein involved in type VI secretion
MSRQPATRTGDQHVCPDTKPAPHIGGPVRPPGAALVTINQAPGSRLFDHAGCIASPVDVVMSGASTVLVHGMPAVRITEDTLHGGTVVAGEPSVEIGGPSIVGTQTGPGTFVAYDPFAKPAPRLFIVSYIAFVGPNASADYAAKAKAQIESMWGGYHVVRGELTEVTVDVRTSLDVNDTFITNGYDQIAVDDVAVDGREHRSNQQLNGGYGEQKTGDTAPGSYVAAHEYGHTLGLDDQYKVVGGHTDANGKQVGGYTVPDLSKTKNWQNNIMIYSWNNPYTGDPPHPYEEHYNEILDKAGW